MHNRVSVLNCGNDRWSQQDIDLLICSPEASLPGAAHPSGGRGFAPCIAHLESMHVPRKKLFGLLHMLLPALRYRVDGDAELIGPDQAAVCKDAQHESPLNERSNQHAESRRRGTDGSWCYHHADDSAVTCLVWNVPVQSMEGDISSPFSSLTTCDRPPAHARPIPEPLLVCTAAGLLWQLSSTAAGPQCWQQHLRKQVACLPRC